MRAATHLLHTRRAGLRYVAALLAGVGTNRRSIRVSPILGVRFPGPAPAAHQIHNQRQVMQSPDHANVLYAAAVGRSQRVSRYQTSAKDSLTCCNSATILFLWLSERICRRRVKGAILQSTKLLKLLTKTARLSGVGRTMSPLQRSMISLRCSQRFRRWRWFECGLPSTYTSVLLTRARDTLPSNARTN